MRQAWGLDEPQGFWSAFGKNVAYNTWNVISLGTLGRQDTLVEQYEAGQISNEQYWGRTAINAGSSVAIGVAAAATGGAAGLAASSLGAGAVATGAIAGAAAGIGGQAATDILEVGALGTKSIEDVSATDYLIAGGGGALFGGLAGKAYGGSRVAAPRQARATARQGPANAPKGTTVVESAPPPRALPPGDAGRGGARFIADADGGVLDLAAPRGRLNAVPRQGPFELPAAQGTPRAYGTPYRQLGSRTRTRFKEGVSNRTLTRPEWKRLQWHERLQARRDKGVSDFWAAEKRRIRSGEPGTRPWSPEARAAIQRGERPRNIFSHHKYSVSEYPHLANDPGNIYPVTYFEHRFRWHGGRWGPSHGVPQDPTFPEWF